MRCQSGLGSAGPRLMLVIASAGAYSAAPITAPGPTPTPSIASPSTAPDAAPRAAPQISASSIRPERLRLRRSGSPMIGSNAAFQRSPRGTTWSYSSRPLISYDPRDGAKGRGGRLGAREGSHRRGVGAGAGVRGPHDDRPRRVGGRDDPVRSDGRRPRPWARARVTHRPGPRRTGARLARGIRPGRRHRRGCVPARAPPYPHERVSGCRRPRGRRSAAERLAGAAARPGAASTIGTAGAMTAGVPRRAWVAVLPLASRPLDDEPDRADREIRVLDLNVVVAAGREDVGRLRLERHERVLHEGPDLLELAQDRG